MVVITERALSKTVLMSNEMLNPSSLLLLGLNDPSNSCLRFLMKEVACGKSVIQLGGRVFVAVDINVDDVSNSIMLAGSSSLELD